MPEDRLAALDIDLSPMFDGLRAFCVGGKVLSVVADNHSTDDTDLMVAGATPKEMVERGFDLIVSGQTPEDMTADEFQEFAEEAALNGNLLDALKRIEGTAFPVFLDSQGREVAVARVERSTGDGHHAFEMVADADVTVEEDLERRDLTVNAMAVSLTDVGRFDAGELIDPFDGRGDVDRELIRMVRPESFAEDPLRILRMARFAARLGFSVEDATLEAARENVDGLHNLPQERWGLEMVKAMKQAQHPSRFFRLLDEVDALDVVVPELAALKGVPAGPPDTHREGDAFEHTMLVLEEMADLRPGDARAMFAAMAHDLGKGMTRESELPSHPKHHVRGVSLMRPIQNRLELPSEFRGVMESASRFHMRMHRLEELNESTLLDMVEALRDDYEVSNPGDEAVVTHVTLDELIDLADADSRGREPSRPFDCAAARERFDAALAVLDEVGGQHVIENFDPQDGEHFGNLLLQERVLALRDRLAG